MWGWQVGLYLFLGGLSGGSFAFAALLQLAHGRRAMPTVRRLAPCCACLLALGCALLLTDVSQPLRALAMPRSFGNVGTSWMARGVWIIMGAGAVFSAYALIAWLPAGWSERLARTRQPALNALGIAGLAASLLLIGYTGMLLADSLGIPAWHTPLLPALFVLSSLETGTALGIAVTALTQGTDPVVARTQRRLEAGLAAITAGELAVLVLYARHTWDALAACHAARPLLAAAGACLVAALLAQGASLLLRGRAGRALPVTIALAGLAGGCLLRFGVLALGTHAATLSF